MENLQPETAVASPPRRRWPLFWVGVLLFLLGLALYTFQFRLKHTGAAWYVPVLASIGVLFMVVSVWQRRGVLRSAGLVLFVLLCGLEWFLVVGTIAPPYTGPAQPGSKIPAFASTLANGKAFTNADLENGVPTVLVFFRGRW